MNRFRPLRKIRRRYAMVMLLLVGLGLWIWWRRPGSAYVMPPFEVGGTVQVVVLDDTEERIANAMVVAHGFRAVQDPGSFYSWIEEEHGKLEAVATDEDGIANVPYPKWVDRRIGLLTSGLVVSVEHPDYCLQTNINCYLPEKDKVTAIPRVHLHKGGRLKIRAYRDGSEVPLTNFHADVSGDHDSDCWRTDGDARLSPTYASGPRVMRITDLTDPARPQYSEPVLFDAAADKVHEREIRLCPGIVLRGRLDVQKPVLNGRVVVKILDLADGLASTFDTSLVWSDWTTVNEDGSFEFPSLPPTTSVSMMAYCDGYISKLPEPSTIPFYARSVEIKRLTQYFQIDPANAFCQVAMEPAAECAVTVTGPFGEPIEGVSVEFYPNVEHGIRGSTMFGWASHPDATPPRTDSTYTEWVLATTRKSRELPASSSELNLTFGAISDANGKAHIKTLPGRGEERVYVVHDRWVARGASRPPFDPKLEVNLESGKTAKLDLVVEPKPKLTPAMLAAPPTASPTSAFSQAIQAFMKLLGM